MTSRRAPGTADAVSPAPAHVMVLLGQLFSQGRDLILELGPDGLRSSQHRVLHAVPPEGTTMRELADRVGMTPQGMGQFVTVLVESGHLAVHGHRSDRRLRIVTRTAKGTRAVHRLASALDQLEARWREQVGAERYAAFRSVLEELAAETPVRPGGRSQSAPVD